MFKLNALFLVAAALSFAQDPSFAEIAQNAPGKSNYSPPEPAGNDSWVFFVDADWLFWKPFAEGYEFAYGNQTIEPDNPIQNERYIFEPNAYNIHFNFGSNYRIIAGSCLRCLKRDILAKFTRVTASATGRKFAFGNPGGYEILGPNLSRPWTLGTESKLAPGYIQARQAEDLKCFDFEFGRVIWDQGPSSYRMQVGARAASLKSTLELHCEATSPGPSYDYSALSDMKIENLFQGGGPRFGGLFDFRIYKGVHWLNEFGYAILWGRFDMKQNETFYPENGTATQEAVANLLLTQHTVKQNFQLSTALAYLLQAYSREFKLKIGYEIDYWLNMNILPRFTSAQFSDTVYVRQKGDVYFHGLVGEAGLAF